MWSILSDDVSRYSVRGKLTTGNVVVVGKDAVAVVVVVVVGFFDRLFERKKALGRRNHLCHKQDRSLGMDVVVDGIGFCLSR